MEEGSAGVGLMENQTLNQTLVAQAPRGVLDPATGKPVGETDPFFVNVSDQLVACTMSTSFVQVPAWMLY